MNSKRLSDTCAETKPLKSIKQIILELRPGEELYDVTAACRLWLKALVRESANVPAVVPKRSRRV
jgi:hypothetical protein